MNFSLKQRIYWQDDELILSLQWKYSNGKLGKKYGKVNQAKLSSDNNEIILDKNECIIKVILYKDRRLIDNDYASKIDHKTELIVGITFQTNMNKNYSIGTHSDTSHTEQYPGYCVGHITGLAGGYIDSLQVFWYKIEEKRRSIVL